MKNLYTQKIDPEHGVVSMELDFLPPQKTRDGGKVAGWWRILLINDTEEVFSGAQTLTTGKGKKRTAIKRFRRMCKRGGYPRPWH